ncbi:MAG TPA: SRPBCC domain-containing protein [Methanoregula sp.]|nr:SRPBCC domain-containing protein [Methanoregula sp.]
MTEEQHPPEYRKSERGGELWSAIEISATPERVWEILTAFAAYPDWNPFIRNIRGDLVEGGQITADLRPTGSAGMTIRPFLLIVNPPHELRWRGHLLFQGLFDGEHVFEIRPLEERRSLFIQHEYFSGLLLPLLVPMLKRDTARGFFKMNEALKIRAEQPPLSEREFPR